MTKPRKPPREVTEESTTARALREARGKRVREVWIAWAREQANPKASWLVSWDDLPEPDRQVDRLIGEALAADERAHLAASVQGVPVTIAPEAYHCEANHITWERWRAECEALHAVIAAKDEALSVMRAREALGSEAIEWMKRWRVVSADVARLTAENEALRKEAAETDEALEESIVSLMAEGVKHQCSYCGHIFTVSQDCTAHVMECAKRPEAALRSKLALAMEALGKADAYLVACDALDTGTGLSSTAEGAYDEWTIARSKVPHG